MAKKKTAKKKTVAKKKVTAKRKARPVAAVVAEMTTPTNVTNDMGTAVHGESTDD
jgi:hypothetical protein